MRTFDKGRRPRVPAAAWSGAVALGVTLLAACTRAPSQPSDAPPRPNVVLVTIEGLRADRVGAFGDGQALTPALDRLAGEGLLLADLLAVSPHAVPALTSILTGLLPAEHGVWTSEGAPLAAGTPTLASVLRDGGYETGAFLAGPLRNTQFGLSEAFGHVERPEAQFSPVRPDQVPRMRPRAFGDCPSDGVRRGDQVVKGALDWLAQRTGLSDPPKTSPRTAAPNAASEARARLDRPFFVWAHLADLRLRDTPARTHVTGSRTLDPYAIELAYIDLQLGRLLALLDRAGLQEQTLVVVVGTHGLDLGEDALDDEGLLLTEEVLRVPGLLRWAGRIPAGIRLEDALSQAALAPTVLGLLADDEPDLPALPAPPGRAIPTGRLLAAQASGGTSPPTLFETRWPRLAYGLPTARGGATSGWWWVDGEPPRPREALPESSDAPPDTAAWWGAVTPATSPAPSEPALPPHADFELAAGVDRGEFVRDWSRVARRMRRPGPSDETLLEACRELVAARPEHATFHTWLGIAHGLRRETAEAIDAHRRALDLDPGAPHRLSNLGLAYLDAQRIPEAIDLLEDAYLARPADPAYRDNLATVLMHTGVALARQDAFNDAMACMTRVLLLQPENPAAHVNMGSVYQAMGRKDLAESSFRRALELRPGYSPAKQALTRLQEVP